MKTCSCGERIAFTPRAFIGLQSFPGLNMALFNCAKCGSTAAIVLHGSIDEVEEETELAAE